MFDTEFIAAAPAPAASTDLPIASPQGEPTPPTPVETGQVQPDALADPTPISSDPGIALPIPIGTEPTVEGITPPPGAETPDDEAELQAIVDNPLTPQFAREKIKQAMGYANSLKTDKLALQTEFETFRQQYDGKEALSQPDLERLRAAEDMQFKLSSFSATPDDILTTLKDTVGEQRLKEVKNNLAWEFLETADGKPNMESLQVVIDRFVDHQEGQTRVQAKDVLAAAQALKSGSLDSFQLHPYATEEEFEAHKRAQTLEAEAEQQRTIARSNAEFQERSTRTQILTGVIQQMQGQFQPQVDSLLDKFHLRALPNEPKVATEFKQAIQEKISGIISNAPQNNRYISEAAKAIQFLGNPTGADAQAIQNEINGYVSSTPYQQNLSRGISELVEQVEKAVTREAYQYKLMMMGYELEQSKGQTAREVLGAPNQSADLGTLTPEQLAKMSVSERTHHTLMQASEQLRQSGVNRYGG
jgi:hypothetical protein